MVIGVKLHPKQSTSDARKILVGKTGGKDSGVLRTMTQYESLMF